MTEVAKPYPCRELLEEAAREREIADSQEGKILQDAIDNAMGAYFAFLDRHGLIWDANADPVSLLRLKARSLVATYDCGTSWLNITLKDGAIDRVYGNGVNPDPDGRGPSDIPHKWRDFD
jgi:hypothetical protein